MATLKDVAKSIGVSISTVSRVLNKSERVDPHTRARVLEAMRELNYMPNDNARRLKTNHSNVLGVIVPDITNAFFANAVRGIEKQAAEAGYSVLLCDTDGSARMESDALRLLCRQKVAGIISATVARNADEIYGSCEPRVVFIDNTPDFEGVYSTVTIDNVRAAREAANILIDRGKKTICMISGPIGESSSDERLSGYRSALSSSGLSVSSEFVRFGDNREGSGYALMTELLNLGVKPDAVFIANDFMAYGALRAIMGSGLRVPDDITIAAFDILDYTGLAKGKFINVLQPAFDIGVVSAGICLDESDRNSLGGGCKIILKHKIEM